MDNDHVPAELAAIRRRFDDTLADVETRQLRRIEEFERMVLARQHTTPPSTTAPPVRRATPVDYTELDTEEDRRYQEDAW